MSAKHFSEQELDEQLAGYESTSAWIERRARRLLKRRQLSRAEQAELSELHARNEVMLRDVTIKLQPPPEEAA